MRGPVRGQRPEQPRAPTCDPGRYTDLASLVGNESRSYDALTERVKHLNADIKVLTDAVGDRKVNRYQRRIERLSDPAGLVPRSGPGVTVTLADAPSSVVESSSLNVNYLVVHQQDIQAVVNAMWKAGASAVTIQGQRVVSHDGHQVRGAGRPAPGRPLLASRTASPRSATRRR